jgi:asparagine synthase (glutamine-hydrolysing)
MCGIAGYWGYLAEDLGQATFEAFTHSLAHRGPDGFGIEHFANARLWLGHRRLAIIDLSERGRQPFSYANGRYWLTYNGEVYNYVELREELSALGHRFVSNTDTEVVVAAFAQWGPDCQLRFNGMWAFAIWDACDRQLFLSRDRFGVKPLHYSLHNGAIAFASELKAFLNLPWVDGAFDVEVLSETLSATSRTIGRDTSAYTLLPDVRSLPAGHAMLVKSDGSVRITRWWNTLEHLPKVPTELRQQAHEFRDLFFDACRVRLRSDVPPATALSGGLDSSAVACTISELGRRGKISSTPGGWQRAFVACFTDTPLDEQIYARAIVQHTGMTAHYENVDVYAAVKNIEKVIFDLEGIFPDPMLGTWTIYQAMRANGIRVSLDGTGSDELLGGYTGDVQMALGAAAMNPFDFSRYLDLTRVLRGCSSGSEEVTRTGNAIRAIRYLVRSLVKHELKRLQLLEPLRGVRTRIQGLRAQLSRETGSGDALNEPALPPYFGLPRLYYEELDSQISAMSPLQARLFSRFHGGLLPTILRLFDRASMAHGVEARMPFMDWRLVTYGFALPEMSKMGGGFTKRVLRVAMDGLMPDSIRLRTNKIAFVSPLNEWTRGPLSTWVRDICASRSFLESPAWNGRAVSTIVERAIAGRASIRPVWSIIHAHVLEQAFRAQTRSVPEQRPEFHSQQKILARERRC